MELAGQFVQPVLTPGMKYWLGVQQYDVAPSGEQNLVVPALHVPVQVESWASYSMNLSIVRYVSDVPVVFVIISLK
jgi:hypothetical protein